jgi:hypothetical protein
MAHLGDMEVGGQRTAVRQDKGQVEFGTLLQAGFQFV